MHRIAALYHFTRFDDPAAVRGPLARLCCSQGVKGTLLLAREGINGTIAGPDAGIAAVLDHIRGLPGCGDLDWKGSWSDHPPFARLKVRLKREIVTMGQPDVDPRARVGHYVDPKDWNALIRDPEVAVIDTRNDYEVAIGTFKNAVDPGTASFRDFPAWWEANRHRFHGLFGRLALGPRDLPFVGPPATALLVLVLLHLLLRRRLPLLLQWQWREQRRHYPDARGHP